MSLFNISLLDISVRPCNRGFTLIEVLVAIIVLSIGLLGLAGLQATGLRNNHSAYLRTQATVQAYDIIDRMRANMSGVKANHYNNPTAVAVASCKTVDGCTTQQMAQNDAYEWNAANGTALPSGIGVVCIDSTPDDGTSASPECNNAANAPYAVKIWWVDERDSTIQRFVTSFVP